MTALGTGAPDSLKAFLRLSEILTGYEDYELLGTGMAVTYYDELLRIIGARAAGALFGRLGGVPDGDEAAFEHKILDDEQFGPVARNIVMMWYLGAWVQLPGTWRNAYGATSYDTDHVVSSAAYRTGLVWRSAGTHPMSAQQPGFGSWTDVPASQAEQ